MFQVPLPQKQKLFLFVYTFYNFVKGIAQIDDALQLIYLHSLQHAGTVFFANFVQNMLCQCCALGGVYEHNANISI